MMHHAILQIMTLMRKQKLSTDSTVPKRATCELSAGLNSLSYNDSGLRCLSPLRTAVTSDKQHRSKQWGPPIHASAFGHSRGMGQQILRSNAQTGCKHPHACLAGGFCAMMCQLVVSIFFLSISMYDSPPM